MAYSSWRGSVGVIKPTMRPGSLEEFIRMMPDGIGIIPLFIGFQRGTADEFKQAMQAYETRVAELAAFEVDLIHPEGAPPFMVQGFKGEQRIVKSWERKYKTPIVTAGMTQVEALKALKSKKVLGVTYFTGPINNTFAKYFEQAGFEVLAMEGIPVAFEDVGRLASQEVYAHIRRAYLKHQDADVIYMLGSGWRTLDIIDLLEQDLGVPVVHPVPARVWSIQKRLHVNERIAGYGRLLEEMV